MKRIYLDQNKWIDLAKTVTGHPDGRQHKGLLLIAQQGVDNGWLSFPLSRAHYRENNKIGIPRQKLDLTCIMAALSKFHTVAPQHMLLPGETDKALAAFFGDYTLTPRQIQPFGIGAEHALGIPIPEFEFDWDECNLEPGTSFQLKEAIKQYWEFGLLGGPIDCVDNTSEDTPEKVLEIPAKWANNQEQYREKLRSEGWHKGERLEKVSKANSYIAHQELIGEALIRIGRDWGDLYDTGEQGMSDLLSSIPMIDVAQELERHRHQAVSKPWEPNDLDDIDALVPSLVYCDIVVTERLWVNLVSRANLGNKYSTVVLSDLLELTEYLVRN